MFLPYFSEWGKGDVLGNVWGGGSGVTRLREGAGWVGDCCVGGFFCAARSERGSILAGAKDPRDPDVTGGRVTSGVGDDPIQHSVTAGAGQFTHTGMNAGRPQAGVSAKPADIGANRGQCK